MRACSNVLWEAVKETCGIVLERPILVLVGSFSLVRPLHSIRSLALLCISISR